MSLKGNGNAIEIEELSRKKTPYKRVQGELNPADYNFVRLDEQHFVSLLCGKDGSFFSLLDAICSLYRGSANLRWGTKFLSSLHG